MKEVACGACGRTGGEDFRIADGTYVCPECGSSDLLVHVHLSTHVVGHDKLRIKARREGVGKSFREVVAGDDRRERDGKWMHKRRVIDREANTYDEVVVDPESGEVVHEQHELLSNHTGHGSAKGCGRKDAEDLDGEKQDGR